MAVDSGTLRRSYNATTKALKVISKGVASGTTAKPDVSQVWKKVFDGTNIRVKVVT